MAELSTRPLYKKSLNLFVQLVRLLESNAAALASLVSEDRDTSAIGPTVRNECGRFRVWAENVGAHRADRLSLDYRVREATRVKQLLMELLNDLITALQDAGNIISGNYHESYLSDTESWTLDLEGPQDVGLPSRTPFEECLIEISHIITCLYKFSIVARNPTPRDRLEKCADIDMSHFKQFDVAHVAEKFQEIEGKDYLIQRLGKANTKRRQLLRYHEKHHEKIVGHRHAANQTDLFESEAFEAEAYETDDRTEFTQTATTVSAFVDPAAQEHHSFPMETSPFAVDFDETRSEGGFSQTTYTSSLGGSGGQLRVPDPPNDNPYDGEPFQCPYCFTLTSPENRMSWMKHVYRDLRPYVCTFEFCVRSEHLFASRQEWFEHEQSFHRRVWHCNACNESLASKDMFRRHLRTRHPEQIQTEILVQRAEKAIESEQPCPLCTGTYLPRRLQSHLGRHMQQIALFILPEASEASENESEKHSLGDSSDDDEDDPETESLADGPQEESSADGPQAGEKSSVDGPKEGSSADGPQAEQEPSADDPETEHDPESPAAIDTTLEDTQTSQPIDISPAAFYAAAESGDVKRIRLLLTAGADIESRGGWNGQTALSIAAKKGHVEVARLLIAEGADVNSRSGTERSPLSYAAGSGQEQMVRLLLATKGVDFNSSSKNGMVPLAYAAGLGYAGVVSLLLAAEGVDYNAKDKNNEVPLFRAVGAGHADMVRLFLAKEDIDVNSKSTSVLRKGLSVSPLAYAAYAGYAEVVKALLTNESIDVNSESEEGRTPLSWAVQGGHTEVVRLLLQHPRTDIHRKDNEGRTALDLARNRGRDGVCQLLQSHIEPSAEAS